jgi:NTP-dependent ternary system trypsin peptidase co-occuring protein
MRFRQFLLCLGCTIGLSSALAFGLPPATQVNTNNGQISSIDAVVGQVKQALAAIQTTLAGSGLPPLKQVKLTLQTVAAKKGGVTLKLWVINIGGTYEKDKTQQIDIVLTPPEPGAPAPVGAASITQELQDAIVSAAQGVKNAGSGPIPLKFNSLDIQLGFTVKGDVNGGAAIAIVPITVDFTGDLSKTAVQTLTVSFAVPSPVKPGKH